MRFLIPRRMEVHTMFTDAAVFGQKKNKKKQITGAGPVRENHRQNHRRHVSQRVGMAMGAQDSPFCHSASDERGVLLRVVIGHGQICKLACEVCPDLTDLFHDQLYLSLRHSVGTIVGLEDS